MDPLEPIVMPVSELIPYPDNPKLHDDEQVALLAGRISEEGFNQPIVVDKNNVIIKGHGRRLACLKLKLETVPVYKLGNLTAAQVKASRLADNAITERAGYDKDKLTNELEGLKEFNIKLGEIGFDDPFLKDQGITFDDPTEGENNYTRKVESPVYEIKGEKPDPHELYDTTKAQELVKKITEAEVPEEVKTFLNFAAARHNVFNYRKIAEYYAHAPKEVQTLMEDSALIIIDFDKAIENGFVKLTENLSEAYANDKE